MPQNKEELKNKILYRASYRGTKEMDILMTKFVKSIIDDLNIDDLVALDLLVNYDDETLLSLKKGELNLNLKKNIVDIFKKFS
jgi:antitoxin CptB|tara:strand:- start:31 stop:279 length:249 start_codon:yes stop_codon:yes gene_type:complete